MDISPIISLPLEQVYQAPGRRDFSELLEKEKAGLSKQPAKAVEDEKALRAREKEAKQAATGLVSNALILPLLQQLRRSTLNQDGPFSPGKAEKSFGPQFDMQLADRIAQSPKLGIRDSLVARLMKRGQPAAQMQNSLDVHG